MTRRGFPLVPVVKGPVDRDPLTRGNSNFTLHRDRCRIVTSRTATVLVTVSKNRNGTLTHFVPPASCTRHRLPEDAFVGAENLVASRAHTRRSRNVPSLASVASVWSFQATSCPFMRHAAVVYRYGQSCTAERGKSSTLPV